MSATYTTRTLLVACTECRMKPHPGPRGWVRGTCDVCDGTGLIRKADGWTGA